MTPAEVQFRVARLRASEEQLEQQRQQFVAHNRIRHTVLSKRGVGGCGVVVVVGEELKDNNHETSNEWLVEAASSGEAKPSAAIL